MRTRSFFKTFVLLLFFVMACLRGAYANGEKDGLSCEAGSDCGPMMDTWCQQNDDIIRENASAGHYKYVNPINCSNPLCCIDAFMYKCERVQQKKSMPEEEQKRCRERGELVPGACEWDYYYTYVCKSVMQPNNAAATVTCMDELFTATLEDCTGGLICHTLERYGWSEADSSAGRGWRDVKYISCAKKGEAYETEGVSLFVEGLLDIDTSGCWLCPLLEKIFVEGDRLASTIYRNITRGMLLLLGVFAALLLLWVAFRAFVDFSGKEVRSFLQKSAGLFMSVGIAAALLAATPRVFGELIYDPFISLGTGLGLNIIQSTGETNHPQITYLMKHLHDENAAMGCTSKSNAEFWKNPDLMFTKSSCNALVGLVEVMSAELLTPLQFGQTLMRWAWSEARWGFFPRFTPFLTGLIMVGFFFWALLMLPFKVVDIFVQLAVVGCLSPIALTLFVFPPTRSYTQGVWKMFISCMLQLVMLSLMVALAVALFVGTIDKNTLGLFLANQNQEAFDAIGLGGTGLLVVLALAYIALRLMDKAGAFAQQLGGSVNGAVGTALQGRVNAATSRAAGVAVGAVWDGTRRGARRLLRPSYRRAYNARWNVHMRRLQRQFGPTLDLTNPVVSAAYCQARMRAISEALDRMGLV